MRIEELTPGLAAELSKTVTETDVVLFAGITGDFNPAHMNEIEARASRFGGRIAHGMLSAGFISALLGTRIWPDGIVIYMGQSLQFRRPVSIGDTITAEGEVLTVDADKRVITVRTDCTNQDGEVVVRGEATVMLDELKS